MTWQYLILSEDRFVPNPLHFFIHQQSFHSTLYGPRYWQCGKINHKPHHTHILLFGYRTITVTQTKTATFHYLGKEETKHATLEVHVVSWLPTVLPAIGVTCWNRTHMLCYYSMPALRGTAPAVLRTGSRLGACQQHGDRIFLPRIAYGHLCQLQVFRKWTPTNDC
jgi:hypothetical protein